MAAECHNGSGTPRPQARAFGGARGPRLPLWLSVHLGQVDGTEIRNGLAWTDEAAVCE